MVGAREAGSGSDGSGRGWGIILKEGEVKEDS